MIIMFGILSEQIYCYHLYFELISPFIHFFFNGFGDQNKIWQSNEGKFV